VEELVASVGGEAPFEANESANALMDLRKAGLGQLELA